MLQSISRLETAIWRLRLWVISSPEFFLIFFKENEMKSPSPPVFRKVAQKEPKTKPRKFLAVVQTSPAEPDGMSPPPSPKSAEEPENLFDDEASSPPSRKRTNSGTSSPPPAKRTKQQYEEAPFRDGFVAVRGAKPMAGDHADIPRAIIIRACREFTGRIVGVYMLAGAGLQDQWAQECFRTACGVAICIYRTHRKDLRGKTISTFRTLLASAHGFDRSTSGKVIAANRRKAAKLLTNSAFHYKDPEAKPVSRIAHASLRPSTCGPLRQTVPWSAITLPWSAFLRPQFRYSYSKLRI
ncbi:hypothetical protein R3P38DRAFT_3222528 [Favolaschia claudopus]|uniref:DUF6532 domain-containing protein n=1 Tax=Favolaschia claudopus TaxID=2862362 RepID=A0AAV9ZYN7_9AGAR